MLVAAEELEREHSDLSAADGVRAALATLGPRPQLLELQAHRLGCAGIPTLVEALRWAGLLIPRGPINLREKSSVVGQR